MISIDEHSPPDPSSSAYQNQQQEVSHEALATVSDIDLLKPKDANLDDTNNPHPNFTIRDYVYRSRYKNITRNWPFSRESLQLCLNYSVDNLLPPFESLDSLRSISPKEETVTFFNRKSTDDRFISPTSSCIKSQCHLEEDLDHAKSSSQPTVKKCKFVMKSNSGVEPVEETMAFKVCPVCRTFSSSSNTTLNAHIDQCLSEESSMKSTANPKTKTVKHRIKPRKTRLMVDIYKTARHCTVEELDRRNGTSWATNSNFPDQELEFQAEDKKEQPQEPTFVPNVADNEGAVYIDTNGTKVRILSIPTSNKFDDDNARKLQKGYKGSKFVRGKKKMKAYGQKNHRKILKLSPKSKKFSKKATSVRKENVAINEESHKKDGGENPMKAQANKQMDSLTIRRPPWACSKRTAVAKKRVPVLTKPKEGARLCDGSEDLSITRSKGCKFSSLKKNILVSASREHNAGSKFNLKRKFSALKKPQDSWKQNSRMEEDTGVKLSFEIVNVEKKKSRTSKSSNGNGDSSSGGLEISSESARIEVPFHSDHVGIEGNFMGLRNSLDAEFSKMVGQPVNKFDSRKRSQDDIMIMGHNSENEEKYFEEVDPIPIPGPPGSFLPPSPGADMVSEEELQGNSSLTTTSRVHSNEDQRQHDLMKTDFISDSPVSTVSSPSFARSDKLSLRFTSHQNKKSVNSSDLRSVDHASFTENGPTPCCCSGKGVVSSQSVPSYHQESPLGFNHSINFMPNLFPLIPPPETVKSLVDASVKLPVYWDHESVPSPTTPVLRLMGKNLTVVKTDDDASFKPPCSSPMGQYPQFQNIQNENDNSFFYGYPPHHHVIFNQNQNGSMHQRFNRHPPNNSRNLADSSSANVDTNATKEIIFINDSSENEGHDHHRFKESLIRNRANPYGNDSFQTSSNLQEVVNDGNFGRWVSTETRYPLSSIASMTSSTACYRSS